MELTDKSKYIISKLINRNQEESKYSGEIKLFYNTLYDLFNNIKFKDVVSKEDKKDIIKDININLSENNFMDFKIRKFIKNNKSIRIRYNLKILNREIEIDFYLFNIINLNFERYVEYLDNRINIVRLLLFYMIKNSNKECNNKLKIIIYLTEFEKVLPKEHDVIIGPENVNSGYSYVCIKSGLIVIFRKEEWFKVLIHECIHSFGLEFSNMDLSEFNIEIRKIFNLKFDINIFEAYTEFWAEILNIGIICYVNNIGNKKNYHKCIKNFIAIERFFSIFQAKKILKFYKLNYQDFLNKVTLYKENSNVFSYYIIKAIMMINLENIIKWSYINNKLVMKFDKNKKNLMSFLKLIKEISKNDKTKKILENNKIQLFNNFLINNLRMSLIEI